MQTKVGYKLFRLKKLYPEKLFTLFVDTNTPHQLNRWIKSKAIETKKLKFRPGWHILTKPHAPHLMKRDGSMMPERIWAKVEFLDNSNDQRNHYIVKRPINQGGDWVIATKIKILHVLSEEDVTSILNFS